MDGFCKLGKGWTKEICNCCLEYVCMRIYVFCMYWNWGGGGFSFRFSIPLFALACLIFYILLFHLSIRPEQVFTYLPALLIKSFTLPPTYLPRYMPSSSSLFAPVSGFVYIYFLKTPYTIFVICVVTAIQGRECLTPRCYIVFSPTTFQRTSISPSVLLSSASSGGMLRLFP